jgi:uncharacterized protein
MWELLLPFVGFFIGVLAALTGVGGGIVIVPFLILAYSFAPANAVGTSLFAILITAVAATVGYYRQKRIDYKTGLLLAATTVPGALLGAFITSVTKPMILGLIFGVFLIFVALRVLLQASRFGRNLPSHHSVEENKLNLKAAWHKTRRRLIVGVALGFFGGVASGLLGVGGGIVLVPIMSLVLEMDIHVAVATSMFTMIATSITGVVQHSSLGNINFEYALLLGFGAVVGAQLGAFGSKKLSGRNLQLIFALLLLAVSIQMIIKFAH